jgi:uncharacterized protein YggE
MKTNQHMQFIVFSALALFGVGTIGAISAQTTPNSVEIPKVTVTGTGEIQAKPDEAQISVGVVTNSSTALQAAQENARFSNDVQEAAKLAGITPDDMQTQNYSVNPQYSYPPAGSNEPPKITGYQVSNTVRITERNIGMLSTVLDGVTKAGSNTINSIDFTIQHVSGLEDKALRMAAQRARAKAEIIAAASGMKLGSPISIQEGEIYHPSPMPMMMMARSDAKMMSAAPPISGGKQTVRATVTAVYAMVPLG